MNGRNDLDACWLIAHDARIPLSPAGNVKKRIACALDPKIIPDNIACRGKGEHWLCCVGCCYEVETPANACDTGRQTASYFVLGKLPRLGSCSSVDWQPQQSAASRFVGSETGVEKVKRKQLQRTGPQVCASGVLGIQASGGFFGLLTSGFHSTRFKARTEESSSC